MSNLPVLSYPQSPMPLTIASPLANSTRLHTSVCSTNSSIIINNFNQIVINEAEPKKSRKSLGGSKKPVISANKKPVPKKTTTKAIKPAVDSNATKKQDSVERLLNQINMAKYSNLFKNYDMKKFKELRELDLNAMGITRPQELRTIKEAIKKAKTETYQSIQL